MLEGKVGMLDACRNRKMKIVDKPVNLLESHITASGILDGMEVTIDMHCIAGMPAESQGSVTFRGNLAQILSVLSRVWPGPPESREVVSPGRQSWPDIRPEPKEQDDDTIQED